MTPSIKCTFNNQKFKELLEGVNGYLHAPQIGMVVVLDKQTGLEYLTHLIESDGEAKVIFASLTDDVKNDYASGKLNFWEVTSKSASLLIANISDDYVVHIPTETKISKIRKYQDVMLYRENYKETKSMSDKIYQSLRRLENKRQVS